MSDRFVVAVDVGTASARAGVFDKAGELFGRAEAGFAVHRPAAGRAEHDSEDIWRAVGSAVRAAVSEAGVPPDTIAGVGFDATCSLVVRAADGGQLAVSPGGNAERDTLAWIDHRAMEEADATTATDHPIVARAGGTMSPEMQTPKLMWLKRHAPETWRQAGLMFDLADFLTWRATGATARSHCTLTCKWAYRADAGWERDLLDRLDLADLFERGGLPERATPVGASIGTLTAAAAADLGLATGIAVAAGMVDAYAAALGSIDGDGDAALIAGTSTCLMVAADRPVDGPGLWGSYPDVARPGRHMLEGGQSATGALLDHIIANHGAVGAPTPRLHTEIAARIAALREAGEPDLSGRLHILPDFHGNRSPFADPRHRGVLSGVALDATFDGLCRLYWRTGVALGLGIRQIAEHMAAHGIGIDRIQMVGGHVRNGPMMEVYAAALDQPIFVAEPAEAVLAGTAMAAAAAAGLHPGLAAAGMAMRPAVRQVTAGGPMPAAFRRDYEVFLLMQDQRRAIDALIDRTG